MSSFWEGTLSHGRCAQLELGIWREEKTTGQPQVAHAGLFGVPMRREQGVEMPVWKPPEQDWMPKHHVTAWLASGIRRPLVGCHVSGGIIGQQVSFREAQLSSRNLGPLPGFGREVEWLKQH